LKKFAFASLSQLKNIRNFKFGALISYEKLTPINGKLKPLAGYILTATDVVLVIWKFSIAGTGKWFGKQMKSIKKQEMPKGSQKEILFLWGGAAASELLLGEAALLAQDLHLGVTHNVKPGMEPRAFLKAWKGRLTIEKNTTGDNFKLYSSCEEFSREVDCRKESLRHGMKFEYKKENGRKVEIGKGGPSWFEEVKKSVEKVEKLWSAENFKDRIGKLFKIISNFENQILKFF